ncbi:MAG: hypothetical protein BRD26_03140 [Bacteroidetes bacterium QH_1_64_81]|nr:MAG: hypothetical protein BRD26_03140 [Bacteroidetes bacterium QH_1_64_81]
MSADPARQVVVDALDELGERDTLSYEQRTAADEPYPPSVVEERLKTLRRSQRILRVFLGVVAGLVTLLLAGADVGWTLPRSLVGFELLPLVPPILLAVYKLVEEGKAEQLYALLARVDETTDPKVV